MHTEKLDAITAYIPMDRRFVLARQETLPDRCNGAALFADISGFTPLTAVYAETLGTQRGAEEIIGQLNRVYDALIDVVHNYHGSVIGFSGDALTCWIDGDNGRLATACAMEMQAVMQQFHQIRTPDGQIVPLSLKVVATAGSARRFLIGMPKIQRIEVLAGNVVSRLGAAEGLAEKGEVIVGAEMMAWLGDSLQIKTWRQAANGEYFAVVAELTETIPNQPWPMPPQLPTKLSKDWLLSPVYERLVRGEGDYLAQLRPSVALFLRFTNIDYDLDPEAGLKLDAYIRWVQRVLNEYQGFLIQLTLGDKGSYIYAAFGAPLTYEDNAGRAVAAARALQSPPRGLRFCENVEIGISQGMVRMGAYGGEARKTYGAQGNEVNIAARLMSKAEPGQIIVSPQIMEATNNKYTYRALGPVRLKGVTEPMPIFLVGEPRQSQATGMFLSFSQRPMVGRGSELAQLHMKLKELQNEKRGGTVLIEGEAGIGKSRLVGKLVEDAYNAHIPLLIGAGNVIEQTMAYHAWRSIFRDILNITNVYNAEIIWQQMTAVLEDTPQLLDRIPLLNDVLSLNLAENELTQSMVGDVRATNTRQLLVSILAHAIRQSPRLLLIEDAHWLDSASWALLEQVIDELPTLLVVIVARPLGESSHSAHFRIRVLPNLLYMPLSMLAENDVTELISLRLGVQQVPKEITQLIHQRAEGHPFFSEELTLALRESALIRVENGRCFLAENGGTVMNVNFPNTIQQVITQRIDRLSPAEQLTLKVASVIGRVFAVHTLTAVHPVTTDKPKLPAHLDTLTTLEITLVEMPEPPIYSFKHSLTQEVAYNLLLFEQRRDLHHAVALWYEKTYENELPTFYPTLAHHWLHAEQPEKAIYYLGLAGEQALRSGAYREAIKFLTQLLDAYDIKSIEDKPIERAHWERVLAEAYWGIGDLNAVHRHASRVLDLLDEPEPKHEWSSMFRFAGQFLIQTIHLIRPSLFRGRLENTEKRKELGRSLSLLAQIYYLTNEPWRTYHLGAKHINLEEQISSSDSELARAYAQASLGLESIQLHRLARHFYRQAEALVANVDYAGDQALNYLILGMHQSVLGRWQSAEHFLQKTREISEEIGDWRTLADSWQALGYIAYFQGDVLTTGKMGYLEYDLAERQGNFQQQAWGIHLQALQQARMGQVDAAIANWQSGLRLHGYTQDRVTRWMIMGGLVEGYLLQGHYQDAYELATELLETLGKQRPIMAYLMNAVTAVPQLYLTLWREKIELENVSENWQALAKQAIKHLDRYARAFSIGKPRAYLYQGEHYWLCGATTKAISKWQKALQFALDLEMRYEAGLAHLALGQYLTNDEQISQQHLASAKEIFMQCRATTDLAVLKRINTNLEGMNEAAN